MSGKRMRERERERERERKRSPERRSNFLTRRLVAA